MLNKPVVAWAIVDADDGTLVTWEGHAPIYRLRSAALAVTDARGLRTTGKTPEVRICRVQIRQWAR